MSLVYLDHNATAPPRAEALEAMVAAQVEAFGNPSSQHAVGRKARALLESCRERLASTLGVRATEIVFTSGGTESNRLAVEGALESLPSGSRPLAVVSAMEHPSVLEVYARLEAKGCVTPRWIPGGPDGRVDLTALEAALKLGARIVSLQHANSETGVLQPVSEVGHRLRSAVKGTSANGKALLHVDCVQSFGKTSVRPDNLGADLVTISSHKIGGPKGAGALIVRAGCGWEPPLRGGPQERKMRPGTENLPSIAGFVKAAEVAVGKISRPESLRREGIALGAFFKELLLAAIADVEINGGPENALPNTVNVSFREVSAELLLIRLDQEGVAVSMGSACASGSREPSHVLKAMGLSEARIRSAVRFSTGWSTTREEVERAVKIVAGAVAELRRRSGSAPLSGSPARHP